jgi:hypothetical protein
MMMMMMMMMKMKTKEKRSSMSKSFSVPQAARNAAKRGLESFIALGEHHDLAR